MIKLKSLIETIEGIEIKPIEKSLANDWAIKYHYLHRKPTTAQNAFGIFKDSSMIGIVVYGSPTSPVLWKTVTNPVLYKQSELAELLRLYIHDIGIKNLESYVISRANKLFHEARPEVKIIVSYADSTKGHTGIIYQATNSTYQGDFNGKHRYLYFLMKPNQAKQIKTKLVHSEKEYPSSIVKESDMFIDFDKKHNEYEYVANCINPLNFPDLPFSDATEMQQAVDAAKKISPSDFLSMTTNRDNKHIRANLKKFKFYYNEGADMAIAYDFVKDIHYFFMKI